MPAVRVETLALAASLFFALACNGLFWHAVLADRPLARMGTLLFSLGLGVAMTALQFVFLALLMNRWTAKPVLAIFIVCTAVATYYMNAFTVFIDQDMLRNVLRTDVSEASELLSLGMLPHLALYAGLPLALLWRVRIKREAWRRALTGRLFSMALAFGVAVLALLSVYSQLAPLMRNHKEIRYLVTPGNVAYSLVHVLNNEASAAQRPRLPVGTDATLGAGWAERKKPVLFVIVVGETVRAANWGLSGYARQTTPKLAQREVINFAQMTSCGTNTEVSVPCMFSVHGRRHYDDAKIHQSESLLNVLSHAGFNVLWRDNQSGCKGACTGVGEERLSNAKVPELCDGQRCLDEILLHDLDRVLADRRGNRVLVLHQLGNHGPAYFERYPAAFRRFQPTCDTADIATCSTESIVNSYDNALLYTDHVLAKTIDFLRRQAPEYDTAMIYLSDHGESLGENGLFLHGVPYAIAPAEQTRVPLVMWFSPEYARDFGVDTGCLRARAARPASHDNLFHSVLGLLDVRTHVYDAALDVSAACRSG
ncbi:phosphoethanolamine transferase [Propionivibrio limicola]|uniref:phosphoethanolamine transferase n=1 Tax=Propionivibrio limicola TaxID=167645 RepID=UPI001FE7066D|nr:phosphoethanolamine--lipid A transferase [Propionivibrio limicola]